MKIKLEHFEILKAALVPLDTAARRAQYRAGAFPRAQHVKDLDKRYRWDLLNMQPALLRWVCDEIYTYADDAHIDTALRAIVPALGEQA
jgi:hypothetical protein